VDSLLQDLRGPDARRASRVHGGGGADHSARRRRHHRDVRRRRRGPPPAAAVRRARSPGDAVDAHAGRPAGGRFLAGAARIDPVRALAEG